MGQLQSKELEKYQLSFISKFDNKCINKSAYKVNKALNIYYIYFHIENYSINTLINSEFDLYISNTCNINSNILNEDKLSDSIHNKTKLNVIDKKSYYDIEYITSNSNKVIFRSLDLSKKSFDIVYIM